VIVGPDPEGAAPSVAAPWAGWRPGSPWFSPLSEITGQGTMMSVNSYGYTRNVRTTLCDDTKMMFGPIFNAETAAQS